MAALRLAAAALVAATATAAGVTATDPAAVASPPSTTGGGGDGVLRQATSPAPGVLDVWDRDLFASCRFGPIDSFCAPAHRCFQFGECSGRCFVTALCVVETPVGGACAPRAAQACADDSVCASGVCTAAGGVAEAGLGLGDDCGTWVRSPDVRQSLSCAAGLSCEPVYRPDGRAGILTDGFDVRVCQRFAGVNEGCNSYASVLCGPDLFCEQANSRTAAGVVPTAGAGLGGVCRPVADRAPNSICVQTGTLDLCEHNEVCSIGIGGPRRCLPTAREGEYCGRGWLCDPREPGRLACINSWEEGGEAVATSGHGICRPLESRPASAGGSANLPPTPTPAGPTPGPGRPCVEDTDCATLQPLGPGRLFCRNTTAGSGGGDGYNAPTSRQCVRSAELGEPCGEPAAPGAPVVPCRQGSCNTVLLADGGGARSALKCVTWQRPGQACDGVGRVCWDEYTCAQAEPAEGEGEGAPDRRCVRWAGRGQACGVEGVAGCQDGLICEEEGEGRVCVAGGEGGPRYYVPSA